MAFTGNLIVADDIRQEISGKLTLVGVFTNDISIPFEPYSAQLAVLFDVEASHPDHPPDLSFELRLPGENALQWKIPLTWPTLPANFSIEVRPLWRVKVPFNLGIVSLRAGPIESSVTAHGKTVALSPFWIQAVGQSTAAT